MQSSRLTVVTHNIHSLCNVTFSVTATLTLFSPVTVLCWLVSCYFARFVFDVFCIKHTIHYSPLSYDNNTGTCHLALFSLSYLLIFLNFSSFLLVIVLVRGKGQKKCYMVQVQVTLKVLIYDTSAVSCYNVTLQI